MTVRDGILRSVSETSQPLQFRWPMYLLQQDSSRFKRSLSIRPCRTLSIPFKYTPAYRSPTFQIAVCPPFSKNKKVGNPMPVSIQSGEPFSIVVKLENPTSNGLTDSNGPIYPIACEGNGPCNGIFSDAAIAPGQSFLRGSNGTWLDLADFQESTYVSSGIHNLTLGNVCLKAFTTDEPLGSVTYATGNGLDKL